MVGNIGDNLTSSTFESVAFVVFMETVAITPELLFFTASVGVKPLAFILLNVL